MDKADTKDGNVEKITETDTKDDNMEKATSEIAMPDPAMAEQTIETTTLKKIKDYGRDELLAHPLAETFLYIRWSLISRFFYINIVLYAFYLLSFTLLVLWTSRCKYVHPDNATNTLNADLSSGLFVPFVKKGRIIWFGLYFFTATLTVLIFLREAFQLISERFGYIKSKENII